MSIRWGNSSRTYVRWDERQKCVCHHEIEMHTLVARARDRIIKLPTLAKLGQGQEGDAVYRIVCRGTLKCVCVHMHPALTTQLPDDPE